MVNFYLWLFVVAFLQRLYISDQELQGYDYSGVNCKDNDGSLVDWWIIYKPPSEAGPYFESGTNFTYIASNDVGRWKPSEIFINEDSMLQLTLRPLYDKLFKNNLAVLSYGEHSNEVNVEVHSEKGLMFANRNGGVWISHTVPGFPNLKTDPLFPRHEFMNGHMILCMSVNLQTLNAIAAVVRYAEPATLTFSLPDELMLHLPEWTILEPSFGSGEKKNPRIKVFNFATKRKSLRGTLLARSPGDSRCLYTTFAKMHGIVIDVYSHTNYKKRPICEETYSFRHIDSISLKFPEESIYYINNKTDSINFGVSTAATWQRRGQSPPQYLTCTGNIDTQSAVPAKGGLITCLNHYYVWLTFDNLKVKEPKC